MRAEGFDALQVEFDDRSKVVPAAQEAYYLNDFNTVIRGVEARYGGLLNADERDYIGRLKALSRPALLLYVRLVNRKGPYFRVQRLNYPEIGALAAPIAELADEGLLEVCLGAPSASRRMRMLACFTLPELTQCLKTHALPKGAGRAALLEWLTVVGGFWRLDGRGSCGTPSDRVAGIRSLAVSTIFVFW